MNQHFFFPCLHHAFHMWCRALKIPAVKHMMVGQEKKAVEE